MMELRHLRCFLAAAKELHFARAAENLHIEQSPLSRAIKEICVVLFARAMRSTRLTRAGSLSLEHVRRVFTVLQQARDSVQAPVQGVNESCHRVCRRSWRSAARMNRRSIFDFFEIALSQQIKGLHDDLYDVGLAQSDEVGNGVVATAVWSDAFMVAVPARHPLLAHKRISLNELLRHP